VPLRTLPVCTQLAANATTTTAATMTLSETCPIVDITTAASAATAEITTANLMAAIHVRRLMSM